jgi:hypothetical protein
MRKVKIQVDSRKKVGSLTPALTPFMATASYLVCQPRPVANLIFSRATKSQHHNLTPHPQPQPVIMPPEIVPSDSDYASEEDSDFAPDTAPAPEVESSESESEADEPTSKAQAKPKNKKRKRGDEEEAEDVGFENSGDEAVIKEYEAPKRKKGKKSRAVELEDEGGEGGFVRTRSMRAVEYVLFFSIHLNLWGPPTGMNANDGWDIGVSRKR